MREHSSQWQAVTVGVSDRDPGTGVLGHGEWEVEEEWREEGGEGGRGEYYIKIAGLREIISSTGAVANELISIHLECINLMYSSDLNSNL